MFLLKAWESSKAFRFRVTGSDCNAIAPQWLLVSSQSIEGCSIRAWAPLLDFALCLHFFVCIWCLVKFIASKFKGFFFFFAHFLLFFLFGLLATTSIWCLLFSPFQVCVLFSNIVACSSPCICPSFTLWRSYLIIAYEVLDITIFNSKVRIFTLHFFSYFDLVIMCLCFLVFSFF